MEYRAELNGDGTYYFVMGNGLEYQTYSGEYEYASVYKIDAYGLDYDDGKYEGHDAVLLEYSGSSVMSLWIVQSGDYVFALNGTQANLTKNAVGLSSVIDDPGDYYGTYYAGDDYIKLSEDGAEYTQDGYPYTYDDLMYADRGWLQNRLNMQEPYDAAIVLYDGYRYQAIELRSDGTLKFNGEVYTKRGTASQESDVSYTLSSDGTYYIADGFEGNVYSPTLEIASEVNGIPVKAVAERAFAGCSGLTKVVVPDSVISIGEGAFANCPYITDITLPFVGGSANANVADRTTVFSYIFGTDDTSSPLYYSAEQYYSVVVDASGNFVDAVTGWLPVGLTDVVVTDVTALTGAFSGCLCLESVRLPGNSEKIADALFLSCTRLNDFVMPQNITSIGMFAFVGCVFNSVEIPSCVTDIGAYAFYRSSLTEVIIGEDSMLYSIQPYAFAMCGGLESIYIPASVAAIGVFAFGDTVLDGWALYKDAGDGTLNLYKILSNKDLDNNYDAADCLWDRYADYYWINTDIYMA